MAINQRRILGPANPFDNALPAVTATGGGDDSLSQRQPYGPQGVTDQSGPGHSLKAGAHDAIDGRAERNAAEFKAAQAAASGVADAGATGARVAAAGQLVTQGSVPANTFGPRRRCGTRRQ